MQHRPEEVARNTIEQNGGEYTTGVIDLLALFGREHLTDRARWQIRQALLSQGVGSDPDLREVERSDSVRLFLVEEARAVVAPTAGSSGAGRSARSRLRPKTWKGWTAYAVLGLVILATVVGDSEESHDSRPAADTVEQAP